MSLLPSYILKPYHFYSLQIHCISICQFNQIVDQLHSDVVVVFSALLSYYSLFTPGVHYIAFYPGTLNGPLSIALPISVSFVPVFSSQLSDHMDLWGRAKNLFYSLLSPISKNSVTDFFQLTKSFFLMGLMSSIHLCIIVCIWNGIVSKEIYIFSYLIY